MSSRKHPKGLTYLFVIEIWERFGFAIMQAVYVLYMDKTLGFSDSTKGTLYGAFLGACYLFPLLGGWLGDQILGQLRTVRAGAVMMTFGYVGMALSGKDALLPFYAGFMFIAMGTGIFKVNMSALLGNIYRDKSELKDAGFNIYYMAVNIGYTLGPIAATLIGMQWNDYRMTFWAAAGGMLLSLLFITLGMRNLRSADIMHRTTITTVKSDNDMPDREFWDRILTLAGLFFIAAFFWIPFYQNGMALTLFAERSTVAYRFLRPETYQVFNAIFIVALTPPMLALFARLNRFAKEPSTPLKIFFGLLIMALAMGIMALASFIGGNDDVNIMSPLWLITTYLFITLGEILISPMGQSYVTKVAPPRIQGLMLGGWFGATALGALSSGLFGKFYSRMDHHTYFLLLAGISILAAILVLLFMRKLQRYAR